MNERESKLSVVVEPFCCSCDEECRGGTEDLGGIPFCESCHYPRRGSLPSTEGQYFVLPKGSSTETITLPENGVSCEPLVYGVIKSSRMCHYCGEFTDGAGCTLAGRPICDACVTFKGEDA